MPQPLSRVKPGGKIMLGPAVLSQYPELAVKVMQTIAHWAHIDGSLAVILSSLLKADIWTGTAMYGALISGEAKKAALLAAAQASLSEVDFVLFQAVILATKPSRERRNDFAHNIWARCDDVPDALLLIHPAVIINRMAQFRQEIEDSKEPFEIANAEVRYIHKANPPESIDETKVMVYRKTDIDQSLRDARSADDMVEALYNAICRFRSYEARQRLLRMPRIQQAIQRLTRENDIAIREQLRPEGDF